MKVHWLSVVSLLLVAILALPASAQGGEGSSGRDLAFEQEILDRLAQINAAAVAVFQDATQAMDAGDLLSARQGYERVLEMAPGFPDAARRLSHVELDLGNVDSGLRYAEQAYGADPSPYNQSALAYAQLLSQDPEKQTEALSHAQAAAQALPEDAAVHSVLLVAGMANNDLLAIRQASAALIRLDPMSPLGYYAAGLVAADDGKWEKAERDLLRTQQLGMPIEQPSLDREVTRRARTQRWLRRGGYAFAGWLVSPLLLLAVGVVLSRSTLATVQRGPVVASLELGRGERTLRSIYRGVIAVTSLYFYISIPFLILAVLAVTGGIFYLFYLVGQIPVRLIAVLGLGALYTLYAILRSLFTRVREEQPGRPLPREEAPELWSLAEAVAGRLGTRPVDAIYVTPGCQVAVTERGPLWKRLGGTGQRSLILGLAALNGISQGQFKAILAHEYGHFAHRDTAGGDLAHQVQASVHHMAYVLAASGQAHWYNPAWLFVKGFGRIFMRVTLGASRLQELLADRYAAMAYGARNFTSGLAQFIRQDLTFHMQVEHEITTASQRRRRLQNLYTLPPLRDGEEQEQLEARMVERMSRPTSAYDSHPAPRQRIALLEQLQVPDQAEADPQPAWELLSNAAQLQAEMMDVMQERFSQEL